MAPAGYVPRFGPLGSYLVGRLLAFVLDVFAIAFAVATFIFHATLAHALRGHAAPLLLFGFSLGNLQRGATSTFVVLAIVAFAIALIFMWLCETIFGTTLGKLLFGLAIRRSRGGRAGPARVFWRNLLRPVDALVIGPLLALVTPKHQRLGDLLGGTIVVRSPLGPLATLLGLIGFVAIGYAQIAYGGGVVSAAGVAAQAALAIPRLVGGGGGTNPPSPAPSSAPTPVASASPQPSATPEATPSSAATDEPTGLPSTGSPTLPSAQPTELPSDVPSVVPSEAPSPAAIETS
ncbi:MAG: RDD family protein [Vulcanimicrobiaceae bacterium]